MSAMAIAIGVDAVVSVVAQEGRTPAKVWVGGVDACVDDVAAGSRAAGGVVDVVGGPVVAVRDARKAPGRVGLGGERGGADDGVVLDVGNLVKLCLLADGLWHGRCEYAYSSRQTAFIRSRSGIQLIPAPHSMCQDPVHPSLFGGTRTVRKA